MNDLEELKTDLFLMCQYDREEPNYVKYNQALLDTIDNMSMESVLFAISDIKRVMK